LSVIICKSYKRKKNVHMKNTEQSCIKFNSSSVHGIELRSIQVQFNGQKLNLNCWSLLNFFNLVQSQFRESRVPPTLKREGTTEFCVSWQGKKPSSSSFLQGGTPTSLNWLWTQLKKVQWWVERQLKLSLRQMNWTRIDHWVCEKTEFNSELQF